MTVFCGATQVFVVVDQALHVGDTALLVQLELLVCVIEPVCPVGHESVCDWGESGTQVADVDVVAQVLTVVVQFDHMGPGHDEMRV
jgi:hypothetical protein